MHEYGGDHRSWEAQLGHFSRGWRCITMASRGYPPSACPTDETEMSQDLATRDVIAVLDAAKVERAHIVGLSMGAYTALMCAVSFPQRVLSVTAAGGGSGAPNASREQFVAEVHASAAAMQRAGKIDALAMGVGATRVQLLNKDPRGWDQFVAHLAEHPAEAAAMVLRRIQAARPSLYDLEAELKAVTIPTLLMVGDEDEPCLDVNLWMKRLMPAAQLAMLPGTGHAVSLEEPALFNASVERFLVQVDRGAWKPRDPRAIATGVFTSLASGSPGGKD